MFTHCMPERSKPEETRITPSFDENQRRVVAFFMLLSQISARGDDAQETGAPDEVSADYEN